MRENKPKLQLLFNTLTVFKKSNLMLHARGDVPIRLSILSDIGLGM